jgi:hypothetical protein
MIPPSGLTEQLADSSAGASTSTTAQPGGNAQAQDDLFSDLNSQRPRMWPMNADFSPLVDLTDVHANIYTLI